jgi:hypothetical protein
MKKRFVLFLVVVVAAGGIFALAHGKQAAAQKAVTPAQPPAPAVPAAPAKESAGEQKAAAPGPVIGQQADRLLRQMSDYLKAAKQFSFHADIVYDDLLPSGQKIQLAASDDVLIRRPDRIYAEFEGERGSKRFWYDGKTVTLYDSRHHVYGTEEAPPAIDAMLDHLTKAIGFAPPFSDLAYSDPYTVLTQNVQYGFYAGMTQVGGERCHHLAFQEKKIDWQIWIEDGTQLVPRKLVITYKTLPGAPQFMAVFSHWDLVTPAPEGMFATDLPSGAARIAFLTMANKQAKGGEAQ